MEKSNGVCNAVYKKILGIIKWVDLRFILAEYRMC